MSGGSNPPVLLIIVNHGYVAILAFTKHVSGNQVPGKCPEQPVKLGIEPRE